MRYQLSHLLICGGILGLVLSGCGGYGEQTIAGQTTIPLTTDTSPAEMATDTPIPTPTVLPTPTIAPTPTVDLFEGVHSVLLYEYDLLKDGRIWPSSQDVPGSPRWVYKNGNIDVTTTQFDDTDGWLLSGQQGNNEQVQFFLRTVGVPAEVTVTGNMVLELIIDHPSRWAGVQVKLGGDEVVNFMFTGDGNYLDLAILRPGLSDPWDGLKGFDSPGSPIRVSILFLDDTVSVYQNNQLAGSRTDPLYSKTKELVGLVAGFDTEYSVGDINIWGDADTTIEVLELEDYQFCRILEPDSNEGTVITQQEWQLEYEFDYAAPLAHPWEISADLTPARGGRGLDFTVNSEGYSNMGPNILLLDEGLQSGSLIINAALAGMVQEPGIYRVALTFRIPGSSYPDHNFECGLIEIQ